MSISNQVSQMLVTLATDVEDPVERIKAVQERIKPAKEMMKRATALTRVGISLPPLGIPIDQCLVSRGIQVANVRTGNDVGSDHLPLIVDLAIPQK